MADEGVHDLRELNRQLIRGWGMWGSTNLGLCQPVIWDVTSSWAHNAICIKVILHEDDSQRPFLAQHIVATLLRHCFE